MKIVDLIESQEVLRQSVQEALESDQEALRFYKAEGMDHMLEALEASSANLERYIRELDEHIQRLRDLEAEGFTDAV
jgi:dsDNA-binding SOS-regulon protein